MIDLGPVWRQYRRTFVAVQSLVVIVVLGSMLAFHVPALVALVGLAVPMELAAFGGAAWSARIKRKIDDHHDRREARRPMPPL